MVTPSCTSPSFHQILPLCSIRLSLSAFEKTSVRRPCHWLAFSSVDWKTPVQVFLSGRIATATKACL